jgi:hypothetical protein
MLRENDLLPPDRPITAVVENVDIPTLERNHVLPNMGNPVVRGIGYPHLPHTQMQHLRQSCDLR